MKRPFSATVRREGVWFVSQCLDVDVASPGRSKEEALDNLREALELHFDAPVATNPLPRSRGCALPLMRATPVVSQWAIPSRAFAKLLTSPRDVDRW